MASSRATGVINNRYSMLLRGNSNKTESMRLVSSSLVNDNILSVVIQCCLENCLFMLLHWERVCGSLCLAFLGLDLVYILSLLTSVCKSFIHEYVVILIPVSTSTHTWFLRGVSGTVDTSTLSWFYIKVSVWKNCFQLSFNFNILYSV